MALEDIGVRLVIEGMGTFMSGMEGVNGAVTKQVSNLGSLASVYEQTQGKTLSYAKVASANLRPALTAVNSLFHTMTSGLLFAMASTDGMSESTRKVTQVLTGMSLVLTGSISVYRLYRAMQDAATIATVKGTAARVTNTVAEVAGTVARQAAAAWTATMTTAQWAYNAAISAGIAPAWAFAAAIIAATWELVLIAAAIAATVAGIYMLIRNLQRLYEWFGIGGKASEELTESLEGTNKELKTQQDILRDMKTKLEGYKSHISMVQDKIKELDADYEHIKRTAGGYRAEVDLLTNRIQHNKDRIEELRRKYKEVEENAGGYRTQVDRLTTAITSNKGKIDDLRDSISAINDELNKLARPRLSGMQRYEDQIFALDQQIKQLRLEELRYGESAGLTARIDALERQREILQLQSEIEFDPLLRAAEESVQTIQGLNDELAPADVLGRIQTLGDELVAQTGELWSLQAVTNNMETQLGGIMTKVNTQLGEINTEIGDLEDATTTMETRLGVIMADVDTQLAGVSDEIDRYKEEVYQFELKIRDLNSAIADQTSLVNSLYIAQIDLEEQINSMNQDQSFWDKLSGLAFDAYGSVGNWLGMQFGGYTPYPQRVMVGERGPEVVMMPGGASVQPNNYNTSYNIQASYSNPQQPQSIAMDLEYIRMRSRA